MENTAGSAQPQGAGQAAGQGGTQAVDRAAALLTLVVEAEVAVTFGELCEAVGLARSTTSRLLAALERTRLVERVGGGEYIGGPLFALYAARHDRNAELARLAHPMLETIGEETGETVHLAVASGGRVAHLDQVDSTFLLGARDWTDVEVPPHCSALGKVLLAWQALDLPEGPLEQVTERTLTSVADLERDLEQARARGFAITQDELELGLSGMAAPVFGPDATLVATVGISGPTARLQDRVDHVGRLLMEQTEALSALLRHGTRPESQERGTT
jgi:IclR family acetate operon transcriptional repressor